MTLASLIAADVTDVFLNSNEFAESVTYTPVGGSGRSIVVVVGVFQSDLQVGSSHITDESPISVYAKKDGTTGINSPAKGDSITRNANVYSYMGIISEDIGSYTLKFVHAKPLTAGSSSGRRF